MTIKELKEKLNEYEFDETVAKLAHDLLRTRNWQCSSKILS